MNQIQKLLTAACFVFAASFMFQVSPAVATAQVASHACGCGNAKCGGCLKGKLFPVKKAVSVVKARKDCGCAACQDSQTIASQVTSDILISQTFLPEVAAAPCACGKKKCGCRKSRPKRIRSKGIPCPQCDCDFCELKVSKTKEKKKCFEVKQKEICIPPVRLPWKKCCPPTRAKVRVVNVLSSKSYECPACKYEWNVFEPEVPKAATPEDSSSASTSDKETPEINEVEPVPPSAPKMNELPDAEAIDLESVPRPPVEGT